MGKAFNCDNCGKLFEGYEADWGVEVPDTELSIWSVVVTVELLFSERKNNLEVCPDCLVVIRDEGLRKLGYEKMPNGL